MTAWYQASAPLRRTLVGRGFGEAQIASGLAPTERRARAIESEGVPLDADLVSWLFILEHAVEAERQAKAAVRRWRRADRAAARTLPAPAEALPEHAR